MAQPLHPDHRRCQWCGRRLADALSRRRGFGPVCWPHWLALQAQAPPPTLFIPEEPTMPNPPGPDPTPPAAQPVDLRRRLW